jgi:abequosyltransferase
MKSPILSICIPNYGRPEFLAKNIEAIAKQNSSQIEIVITDDASPDNIKKIIVDFKKKYPKVNIRFKKHSTNQGFDKNVLSVIRFARGKYCWLLSNDDQILPKAISKITKVITQNPDVSLVVVNYQRFDEIIKKITAKKMISLKKDRIFKNASDFFFYKTPRSYFKILGLNTLTMSVDVFNRRRWLKAAQSSNQYMGYNFIHFFILASIIDANPFIYLLSSPYLRYTSNNHRVWSNPIWHDIRHFFLDHLLNLSYNKDQVLALRKTLRKDEFNEKLFLISQKNPKIYRFLFPMLRKIRQLLGHYV